MCYVFLRRGCNINRKQRNCQIFLAHFRNLLAVFIILFIILIYKVMKNHEDAVFSNIPLCARKFIFADLQMNKKPLDIEYLKIKVNKYNLEESILNIDTYGAINKDTIIMVVLVGKYPTGFKYLLASLSQLWGIDNALIIFSHSYYDENVNTLIKSIDYCRVLQIFYPYSVQLYPNQFPGYHESDCPHDMDIIRAEAINCTGAFSPDIHGHYRNPYFVEKKHQWWWTANKVFENLSATVNHEGIIIFLEDYYLFIDDALYMALYLKKIANSLSQCEFVSLGTSSVLDFHAGTLYGAEVTNWDPKEYSGVLAFDYSVWNSIVSHYDLYCNVDDHSWSRSLYYISLNRRDGKSFKVIRSLMPRAFRITAGPFSSFHDFEIIEEVFQVMYLRDKNKKELSPNYIEVYYKMDLENEEYLIFDYAENNGGWNDPRDKAMCTNMTARKIKKIILDMNNEFKDYIPVS